MKAFNRIGWIKMKENGNFNKNKKNEFVQVWKAHRPKGKNSLFTFSWDFQFIIW